MGRKYRKPIETLTGQVVGRGREGITVGRPPKPIRPPTIIYEPGADEASSREAIKAVAIEHGIKAPEASRLVKLMRQDPKNPEFANLTTQQKASLKAAGVGYDPWRIAPESVRTGEPLPVPGKPEEATIYASTRRGQSKHR